MQNFEKSKLNPKPKGIRFYFQKGGENINEDSEENTNKSEDNEYEIIHISNSDNIKTISIILAQMKKKN